MRKGAANQRDGGRIQHLTIDREGRDRRRGGGIELRDVDHGGLVERERALGLLAGEHQPREGDGVGLEVPVGCAQHLLAATTSASALSTSSPPRYGSPAWPRMRKGKVEQSMTAKSKVPPPEIVDGGVAQAGAVQVRDGGGHRLLEQAQVGEAGRRMELTVALRARSRNADGTVTTVATCAGWKVARMHRCEAISAATSAGRDRARARDELDATVRTKPRYRAGIAVGTRAPAYETDGLAHQALGGVHGVLGIDRLALARGGADHGAAVRQKRHRRRQQGHAHVPSEQGQHLSVRRDHAVGRAEIDAEGETHARSLGVA